MPDETPNRQPPLTFEERQALVEQAVACNSGRAVQGVWHESIVLREWFADVGREELLEARAEAPDGGMASAQEIFDRLPLEEKRETLERAEGLHRIACAEALAQLEHALLGVWEDPRKIGPDEVALFAATPLISRGERLLGELDTG